MKLGETYHRIRDLIENDIEARMIFEHGAHIPAATIIAEPDRTLTDDELHTINNMASRILAGEPLSRIFGFREFYGLRFFLNKATLDPRPETEHLVEAALTWIQQQNRPITMLDLGTGTGCIPITILKHAPNVTATAIDAAPLAVEQAKKNADLHGVANRINIQQSDWTQAIPPGPYDLIVSNPPYISSGEIAALDSTVKNHDPILALDGGEDGLRCLEQIVTVIKKHLLADGLGLIEIGEKQLPDVRRLIANAGLDLNQTILDYAGIPRVVAIKQLT